MGGGGSLIFNGGETLLLLLLEEKGIEGCYEIEIHEVKGRFEIRFEI